MVWGGFSILQPPPHSCYPVVNLNKWQDVCFYPLCHFMTSLECRSIFFLPRLSVDAWGDLRGREALWSRHHKGQTLDLHYPMAIQCEHMSDFFNCTVVACKSTESNSWSYFFIITVLNPVYPKHYPFNIKSVLGNYWAIWHSSFSLLVFKTPCRFHP